MPVDLRTLTPEQTKLYNRLYELAEEARAAGMTEAEVIQAVTDGCSSFEADQDIKAEMESER